MKSTLKRSTTVRSNLDSLDVKSELAASDVTQAQMTLSHLFECDHSSVTPVAVGNENDQGSENSDGNKNDGNNNSKVDSEHVVKNAEESRGTIEKKLQALTEVAAHEAHRSASSIVRANSVAQANPLAAQGLDRLDEQNLNGADHVASDSSKG